MTTTPAEAGEVANGADKLARRLKPLALCGIFLIVACGRWFNLYSVHHADLGFSIGWAAVYGAAFAFVFYHFVDIFLARGLLQAKIAWARTSALYLLALVACNRLLLRGELRHSWPVILAEAVITLAIGIASVGADLRSSRREDYLRSRDDSLPARYLGRHPLRTVFETLFRLLPRPEPVGLYKVGLPDEKSPVVVTGNYELTIRRVVRSLGGLDGWLLVCDSRGINIWCSSLANHFNADKIIRAIRQSRLDSVVRHRTIVLPQLCASNVSLGRIREQTGFSCKFGPVRIEDLGEYRRRPKNPEIRRVRFPAGSRMEMAAGTLFLPAIFTVLIFNFLNPDMLLFILPAYYALSLLNALVFPFRPVLNVRVWSLIYASAAFLAVWAICELALKVHGITYAVTIGFAALYFVNEFEGWSPLVKFSITGAYTLAQIELSADKCTGCGTCVDVCPKGVYVVTGGKSRVEDLDACSSCRSCFVQCPAGAITHSAERINEALV